MKRAVKAVLINIGIIVAALLIAGLITAWALRGAHADRGKPRVATPAESMRGIERCAIAMLTVDGLPVYRHAWCRWDDDKHVFEPMETFLDRDRIIDIKRERD